MHTASLWLSILVPVYNVGPYVHECILSIMDQAPGDGIEIILLNDCSTDNSWTVCQELALQYPDHIKLIEHSKNSGLSAARNTLLDAARGEYIWFIDSDDYLLDRSLSRLKAIITGQRIYGTGPDIILFDYKKRRSLFKKSFPGFRGHYGQDLQKFLLGAFKYRKMYAWLKVSKRELWIKGSGHDDLRFPVGKTFEDIATIPWLLLRCKSYYYDPHAWIYYRIRPGSIMTSVTRTRHYFDVAKHDDLADALHGFKEQLLNYNVGADPAVRFYVSYFIAQEFGKLVKRFQLSGAGHSAAMLTNYANIMEQSSPLDFDTLRRAYLKRLRFWDYAALTRTINTVKKQDANAA